MPDNNHDAAAEAALVLSVAQEEAAATGHPLSSTLAALSALMPVPNPAIATALRQSIEAIPVADMAPASRNRRARVTAVPVAEPPAEAVQQTSAYERPVLENVTAKTKTALRYPVGIELTMIPGLVKDGNQTTSYDDDIVNGIANALYYAFKVHSIKTYKGERPHRDGFAVEAPSPVFEDWGTLKKWYDQTSDMLIEAGCTPHHPKVTSGGGHIHVSKLSPSLMRNIFRDMQNRPYLPWIFNEADDDNSADSFTSQLAKVPKELREHAAKATFDPSLFGDVNHNGRLAMMFFGNLKPNVNWFPDSKGGMLAYRGEFKTLEFRLFEAPSNWEEQEAHIRFVQQYIQWVDATYSSKAPVVTMFDPKAEKALKKEDCEREFRALLDVLGLPHGPYERMIAENLTQRFTRGTRGKKKDSDEDEDEDEVEDNFDFDE